MNFDQTTRSARFALVALLGLAGCATVTGGPPTGGEEEKSEDDQAKLKAINEKVQAQVVWSSSRLGNHDLFMSNADGSVVKPLTKGDQVDWFPRFSPDGQRILFVRSKRGWVSERDANADGKWDLYTLPVSGGTPDKVVDNASWGTWVDDQTILFVRGTKIFRKVLAEEGEKLLVDSENVPDLDGALLQQPQMSRDGKYIAITLRGSKRETGIWDLEAKKWTRTGDGCQINWTPDGRSVYWVHPTGNGTSRVFRQAMKGAEPEKELDDEDKVFIDLPGRRSHEYFPQLSTDGQWLVWAATQRGHDHDVADYEIYIWQVGQSPESAARLTFHSGNDRWPDIYIPSAVADKPTNPRGEDAAASLEKTTAPPAAPATKEEPGLVTASAVEETPKASKSIKRSKVKGKKAKKR